jgi:hypothetical protein
LEQEQKQARNARRQVANQTEVQRVARETRNIKRRAACGGKRRNPAQRIAKNERERVDYHKKHPDARLYTPRRKFANKHANWTVGPRGRRQGIGKKTRGPSGRRSTRGDSRGTGQSSRGARVSDLYCCIGGSRFCVALSFLERLLASASAERSFTKATQIPLTGSAANA